MTPDQALEAAAVMVAFANGRKIECCADGKTWFPAQNPTWRWDVCKYRVAPEPWEGKIWVRKGGLVCEGSETDDKQSFQSRGWRLITAKEVTE